MNWNPWVKLRKRSPEKDLKILADALRQALGEELKSVIAFGSVVSGEFHEDRSDINVLIVIEDVSLASLRRSAAALQRWQAREQTLPVILQGDEWLAYARALPIEFSDMKMHHRMIFGEDPFQKLTWPEANLKAQCAQELAIKLLKLRQAAALAQGQDKAIRAILVESSSSILTLFRAVLRLEENADALSKLDAGKRLAMRLGFDPHDLERIHDLRLRRKSDQLSELCGRYLALVERVFHTFMAGEDLAKGDED